MIGWIKLHRKLRDWQWYDDHNATRLLIHLLISVNYEDKKWKGILIKAGSIVTSWEHLSKDCGLSTQQTRTSMSKLESSGEVTRKATNKFQLITLIKWEELQSYNSQVTEEITIHQQTNNKQVTTTKETKQIKENKKQEKDLPETKVSEKIDFEKLLNYFNSVTNKKCKVINDKTKKQFNARLKEGYTKKDINDAIKNCYNDPYHQENPKYLTLEFISRADKLDKYSNYQKSKSNITTTADDNR